MRGFGSGRRIRWAIVVILVMAGISVGGWLRWIGMPVVAWRALGDANEYELLSLEPRLSGPDFYGHTILGGTKVVDAETREKLNRALRLGVRENNGEEMACFNPRHGIRVTRDGVTTDFVICFECRQVEVFRGGKQIAFFLISGSPQGVFDEVLKGANVPLAAKGW
jgi:hypothetical protein